MSSKSKNSKAGGVKGTNKKDPRRPFDPAILEQAKKIAADYEIVMWFEDGERPPASARTGERTEQVNIRLTAEEKAMLDNRSRAGGFRGVSDFVRNTVLEKV